MTNPGLLELPPGVQLVYLAEGGANVVYRFVPSPAADNPKRSLSAMEQITDTIERCSVPARLRGKLLRLRKETTADLPYEVMAHDFNAHVRPLFKPEELVDQTLIRLPDGLIQRCNEHLRAAERTGMRPKKRHGGYLCTKEPFGLLISDMTVFDGPAATLAEFKPKWLVQSPSAPAGAHRCRTCALREMKDHQARRLGQKEQRSFCPLDLVSERFENVLRATAFIQGCDDRVRLARILFRNPTLLKLQSLQKSHGNVGLRGPSLHSREVSLDMTIRDCTLFIRVCLHTFSCEMKKSTDAGYRSPTTTDPPQRSASAISTRRQLRGVKRSTGGSWSSN